MYTNPDFNVVSSDVKTTKEQIRPTLTYWKDAWRRLKKNRLAIIGLTGVFIIILFGIFGPFFTPYTYSYQQTDFSNIPPRFAIYSLEGDDYVYLTNQYRLILVTGNGELVRRLPQTDTDAINKIYTYDFDGNPVAIDFSYRTNPLKRDLGIDFTVTYLGEEVTQPTRTVGNKTFIMGSDNLGRDMLTRVMYGARISISVAIIATFFVFVIGVTYGSISGMVGGNADNLMMRVVDIIDSIPLLIYVILIMVLIDKPGSGFVTIIFTLGSLYWVGMARMVRGQVIGLKDQEFVLAARVLGVPNHKIITRHIIPNAMGPIIVSMTMMVPTAVFTESFLSFIGLGISAPQASWGTLANGALGGLTTYPYQLFYPSIAIAITMLCFNFLGDGLRSALDPRLRKG